MFIMFAIKENGTMEFVTTGNTIVETREQGIELMETTERYPIMPLSELGWDKYDLICIDANTGNGIWYAEKLPSIEAAREFWKNMTHPIDSFEGFNVMRGDEVVYCGNYETDPA